MKKQILILSLALITLGLILISNSVVTAQSSNEFVVPLTNPAKKGKLKAHLNKGSITVKGTARKDVLVKYMIVDEDEDCDDCDENHNNNHNGSHNEDDRQKSKTGMKKIGGGGMDLEVVETDNYVKVESGSWNNKLNLEIEVPSGFDLEVHTYNDGDLMVANIQGELELTNFNGEITALNISGSAIATTYNGEIRITFDKVTENAPMSYSTYNGDIDITFPSTLKASFKMKTEQGEIYTDFDMNMESTGPVPVTEKKSNVYKVTIDDWKRATLNGGGPDITMKNYHGDIYIRKK